MENIKEKKTFKIAGISIWRILSYFILYCILGFIVETIFGLVTKGRIESRQGFLYGPVCPIYGLGAVIMILALQPLKKNNYILFFGGCVVGAIIEYLISYLGEIILKVNWWDYSDRFLNINGRICLTYSLFWGILALYLMKHLNPLIDKLFDKIKSKVSVKWLKILVAIIMIFLVIDGVLTAIGVKIFFARTVYLYDLDVANKEKYIYEYNQVKEKTHFNRIQEKIFSDKKMMKTFPNLKLKSNNFTII